MFADIILPIPFDSFTYLVPSDMETRVMRGCRVVVPLGKNKIYTGVVLNTHNNTPEGVEVKAIIEVLDDHPVVNEQQFAFWQWIANYYICPLGDVMKAALPGAMKPKDEAALKESTRTRRSGKATATPHYACPCNPLNPAQEKAFAEIETSFLSKNVTLLHGVTSSGKTEIYIHLINNYLAKGKQVLYLLPEIALTTQITERLHHFFGDRMGVYHSKFTDTQRLDVYKRQASERPYQLILGVRSSIFLPFQNLGLVIVDEEHEQSYKQQEPAPRYHARNAAIMLAQMFGAKTLLGTATPSFEVYHLSHKGQYGYVQLTQRYRDMQLPTIEIVDTKEAKRKRQMKGVFSPRLIEVMRAALERKEQIILFQNRRGFSSFIECKTCGWVPRCPHCDVTLTLHKKTSTLTCHYCGYTTRIPERCPACEEDKFTDIGTGTEKVEEQIAHLFEGITTLRMDLDTATTRTQFERIISDFSEHKADILIGTQMVTKGLDFDHVSVVGILDADTMLNLPDFRSYERTFQTLSQVAGRAGRNNTAGHVILQTRSAESDIIRQITQGDYWQMFYTQMTERQLFHYPPFRRLIYVYLRHKDDELLEHLASDMAERLRQIFGERVLGPDRPPIARLHSLYIRKIMLKIERQTSTEKVRKNLIAIQQQMLSLPVAKNLNIYYDVDPL
ncbi:MAG: primosomal protein N' [Bacteroidaceae bacterium]|mgnify:FL=1|nr:primosomal protein N' [Prevotellaceae bacterium]MDD7526861.1 primosomal protein N' [Prevotellaceae bacterium]MDY5761179.1 primosomal protein N' [Bacteroidaceae bacterium]